MLAPAPPDPALAPAPPDPALAPAPPDPALAPAPPEPALAPPCPPGPPTPLPQAATKPARASAVLTKTSADERRDRIMGGNHARGTQSPPRAHLAFSPKGSARLQVLLY